MFNQIPSDANGPQGLMRRSAPRNQPIFATSNLFHFYAEFLVYIHVELATNFTNKCSNSRNSAILKDKPWQRFGQTLIPCYSFFFQIPINNLQASTFVILLKTATGNSNY